MLVDALLQCKIVRVLNLWQKHGVYSAPVVQPLLEIAGETLDDSFGSPGNMPLNYLRLFAFLGV